MATIRLLTFDNVDTGSGGVSSSGLTVVNGSDWTIGDTDRVVESNAPSTTTGTNKYLEQTDITSGRRIIKITNNIDAPLFEEEFEIKIFADGTNYVAGAIFKGPIGSGYALVLDANQHAVRLFDTAAQWRRIAAKTDATSGSIDYIDTETVYLVKIKVETNGVISVYVNNVLQFVAKDTTYTGMYWGFFTEATHAWFDNIRVKSINDIKTSRKTDWMKGFIIHEKQLTGSDITTEFAYGSANFSNSLALALNNNVNTIQLIVPAHMHNVNSNEIWWDSDDNNHYDSNTNPTANDRKLVNAIAAIHSSTYTDFYGETQNVKVILNLSRFKLTDSNEWRGDLNPASRDSWWDNYSAYVIHYAELAENNGVEYLIIGSALRNMEGSVVPGDVDKWVELITNIKAVFSGFIVYAVEWSANQTVLQNIVNNATWLYNVDMIGVNAYFELTGQYTLLTSNLSDESTSITLSSEEISKFRKNTIITIMDSNSSETNFIKNIDGNIITLAKQTQNLYTTIDGAKILQYNSITPNIADIIYGWENGRTGKSAVDFVTTIADQFGKPVLFSEIGYRSIDGATVFPWFEGNQNSEKHSDVTSFETATNSEIGLDNSNVVLDNVNVQEAAFAAYFIKWWNVDWFLGGCITGWTGNPEEGFDSASNSNFWDGDYTVQSKPAELVVSTYYASPNIRQDFPQSTIYTTPEQVRRQLQLPQPFTAYTPVTIYEVKRLIKQAEDWIDLITQTSWRPHEEVEYQDFEVFGIKLNREPVRSVAKVEMFNGAEFQTMHEGRDHDYWVDMLRGTIFFTRDPFLNYIRQVQFYQGSGGYRRPVRITYTWGKYFDTRGADSADKFAKAVEYIATIWTARQLANSNDFATIFPSAVDKVTLDKKIETWNKDIEQFQTRQERLFVV